MKRNEKVYALLCRLLRQPELAQLKCATTETLINEHHIGHYQALAKTSRNAKTKYQFVLNDTEQLRLKALVYEVFGLDIYQDDYQARVNDRVQNSQLEQDEKHGTNATSDVILVNNPTGNIQLNNEIIRLAKTIDCAGLEIRHNMVDSIEHTAIVICENYAPMYYLAAFSNNDDLKDALIIYRGDHQSGKKAEEVSKFINHWRSKLPIYYLGDFDPAGFNIALHSFAVEGCFLPELAALAQYSPAKLKDLGSSEKYDNQDKQTPIRCSMNNQPLHAHINFMNQTRLGFQQEALISADIPLQLIQLNKKVS